MLLIWISYWIFRKKHLSAKLTWIHLFITFIAVFILPWVIPGLFNTMPRRYYDYNYNNRLNLTRFFGNMTLSFLVVGSLLLLSELLLIKNIRRHFLK
jgi:heme/copper-type cytochrome/quinol oxidase subunit 1